MYQLKGNYPQRSSNPKTRIARRGYIYARGLQEGTIYTSSSVLYHLIQAHHFCYENALLMMNSLLSFYSYSLSFHYRQLNRFIMNTTQVISNLLTLWPYLIHVDLLKSRHRILNFVPSSASILTLTPTYSALSLMFILPQPITRTYLNLFPPFSLFLKSIINKFWSPFVTKKMALFP